jgi:Sigma-70 region 2
LTCISKKERKSIQGDNDTRHPWTGSCGLNKKKFSFRRIALRLLGNIADAEDEVQAAFLASFTHLDQFRGQAKLTRWLTTMVINVARMKLRRPSPQAQISLNELTESKTFCSQRCCQTTNQPRRDALEAGICRKTRKRDNTTLV